MDVTSPAREGEGQPKGIFKCEFPKSLGRPFAPAGRGIVATGGAAGRRSRPTRNPWKTIPLFSSCPGGAKESGIVQEANFISELCGCFVHTRSSSMRSLCSSAPQRFSVFPLPLRGRPVYATTSTGCASPALRRAPLHPWLHSTAPLGPKSLTFRHGFRDVHAWI